jgi:hypothetical protein
MAKCQADFDKLSKQVCAEAKVFTMTYGSNKDEFIDWEILGDQEYHYDTVFRPPNSANVKNSIDFFKCMKHAGLSPVTYHTNPTFRD